MLMRSNVPYFKYSMAYQPEEDQPEEDQAMEDQPIEDSL
jgi:hypothetical protein